MSKNLYNLKHPKKLRLKIQNCGQNLSLILDRVYGAPDTSTRPGDEIQYKYDGQLVLHDD